MASDSELNASVSEHFPSIVSLNVGGAIFTTRLSTLLSSPGSMISTMFSGNYPLDKDAEGRYFIDREGKQFSYILNYLRDPIKFTIPVNSIPPVLVEAEYYQILPLVDLLRGHPSLIGTKIIKRYREYLGETYTQLRQSVILAVSNKRHIPVTPFSGCSFQKPNEEIRHHTGTLDDQVSDDSQSSVGGTLLPPTPAQQCTLQTDVRIATPTVIFFENNNESQNTQPNTFVHSLRRSHQRPYNACLSDGHDFIAIDIVSTYWQKSEIWDLLLHDLRYEINTNIELKMENNTVYCRRCAYQHLYGSCTLSIFWLKTDHTPRCSTQESTQYLSTQETTASS